MQEALSRAKSGTGPVGPVAWGRKTTAEMQNILGAMGMVLCCPILVMVYWIALEKFEGSLTQTIVVLFDYGLVRFLLKYGPRASLQSAIGYAAWLLFQAALYMVVPGPHCCGQRTPGGLLLSYTANGLTASIITHALAITLVWTGVMDSAIIAKNWPGLLVVANVYGFGLAFASLLKGYFAPTSRLDQKTSGSVIFDFWAGVELNPRIGKNFDIKFFHNDRPGIMAWVLIDLSWAALQYQLHGYVTMSIFIVIFFHGLYAMDLFYNESWYTRTPDISHDHFGFYLAWGDTVFLPTFYTLQAQFLARHPVQLSNLATVALVALGLTGYYIFRSANHQRDHVRNSKDSAMIWGRRATYIPCMYHTTDGERHESLLLTCGWWGLARHTNYFADLLLSFAMCATCGFTHFIPWSYLVFMIVFLNHRMMRDDRRCRAKYGAKWDQYCEQVPYRMIPLIY